jgi:hypothetical protein
MADQSHLDILQQGVGAWNAWREEHKEPSQAFEEMSVEDQVEKFLSMNPVEVARFLTSSAPSRAPAPPFAAENYDVTPDLSGANLREANLPDVNLYGANLSRVHLCGANLRRANLRRGDLTRADLSEANLTEMDCWEGKLREVHFSKADLTGARLASADLTDANLTRCTLVKTELTGTTLTGCRVYGISAWDLELEGALQQNLNVSDYEEPTIMVDNLEVAQFIYLLLNNDRIRQVIDTITSKVVLILGRFTSERKALLDAIRDALRERDYLPVLFDFEQPGSRDLTETISTLAHMARFIIADITDAKSIPQELQAIVPNLPSVPVQPLLLASDYEYGMFEHFKRYPWVLEVYRYEDPHQALGSLEAKIIAPAETKAKELST